MTFESVHNSGVTLLLSKNLPIDILELLRIRQLSDFEAPE